MLPRAIDTLTDNAEGENVRRTRDETTSYNAGKPLELEDKKPLG